MKVPSIVKFVSMVVTIITIMACAPAVRQPVPLSEFEAKPAQTATKEYRIHAGDLLDIKFFYNPELNEQVTVRPDGRISLMLATEVMAAGVTPAELTEQLRMRYAPLLKTAEIAVIVRSFNSQRIYVDGEVGKPGAITLNGSMSVMEAISEAGGFKDTARRNEVIVVRRIADGKVASTVVNLESALDGSDISQNIALLSYDLVYVPKSAVADVNLWIDQYLRKNIPIPFGLGYNLNSQ